MKKYYYSDGQQQFGPFSKKELKSNNITKETIVWYDGLKDWTKASDVEELADLFPVTPTPPPLPKQKTTTPPPMPPQNSKKDTTSGSNTKKNKVTTIVVGCLLFLVAAYIVGDLLYESYYHKTLNDERSCPLLYVSLENGKLVDDSFTGFIHNEAKYANYNLIQIKFNYCDSNGNIIQSDIYPINGPFKANSRTYFEIQITAPRGLKFLKTDGWKANIYDVLY